MSSIALTGQVESHIGSSQENGTITLTARADGSSSLQMQLASGEKTESQDTFANGHTCSWSGPDGVSHTTAGHNCIVAPAWFFPEIALFSAQLPASGTFSLSSNANGSKLPLHWVMLSPTSASADLTQLLAHIGVYDLEFDPSTFLPATLSYAAHPDDNACIDIPVSVAYSDYRAVNGVNIPFRIQRYFNGVLSLDITVSTASINQ